MASLTRKETLRKEMLARRALLKAAAPDAGLRAADHFLASIPLPESAVVSAYIAIGDEIDPSPLCGALRARGARIALPRVNGKGRPLTFHHYEQDSRLVPGPFGLSEPAQDWPIAVPDVLIVPLAAFDAEGNRLGYGAGFYDMTLQALRAAHRVLAVGYAYAGQQVGDVPHDDSDQSLDWVVTETGARKFASISRKSGDPGFPSGNAIK
jgi:5-formyltetrahydrofolate cyclo-ligase